MIDPNDPKITILRQCALVSISRSAFYYQPAGETLLNLTLMRLIDEAFLETPWYGSRQMARHLRRQGYMVGRMRVRRLMARMGLAPIYQKPRTSIPHPEHRACKYLLRGLDAEFCIQALEEALARYGPPEIFNTDQGSQFTSPRFVDVLKDAGVRVSMDGRGRWMDNVFIERLWRSLKYECVYIHAFETGSELRAGLTKWIGDYNTNRPHSALAGVTPDRAAPEHKLAP